MSIQSMRDNSTGVVTKIIVGLIIVVFALFGFGSITTFLIPVPKVAVVNGENVTQQAMEISVERNRRILRSQNVSPADIDEDLLRQNVLQSLINRELMIQEAKNLRLQYSDEGLDAEIVATPVFQVDGLFNAQQFQLVIGGAGFTPVSYKEEMRMDKEFQQLDSAIRKTAFVTSQDMKRATSLAQQKRDIAFLKIDVETLADSVIVDESEIQDYYDEHSQDFVTPETMDIEYLELKRSDLMGEVQFEELELVAFYEETKELYSVAESRQVAHILIEINDDVTQEQAKETIDGIYAQIMDGEDFASLATQYSNDPGSAENGGDLGFNESGTFVPEFEAVEYDLSVNQVAEPVLTEFGYHIIKLLDLKEANTPTLTEIRENVEEEYREMLAEEIFVTKSARLDELAFESPDLLDPSEELDLTIMTTGHVGRVGGSGIIAASAAVMDAAYSPDVLVDGNNSGVLEISSNHHVVIRVKEHNPSEAEALETVSDQIRINLAKEKATELAEEQAKEMVVMLENGSITRYVADQYGLEWEVVGGATRNQTDMDVTINREAFSLPRPQESGKSVGYTLLPDGGAAVLSVTNINNFEQSPQTQPFGPLAQILGTRQGTLEYTEYQTSLLDKAKVTRLN
jgi:peptidyl-prolyl cis-trans isomerase D